MKSCEFIDVFERSARGTGEQSGELSGTSRSRAARDHNLSIKLLRSVFVQVSP